jgi:hypothetical protein
MQIGEALFEVTQIGKECHQKCAIYHKIGDCIMPKEGIFAKVIKGGMVRPGDEIIVESVLRPYRGDRIVRQIPVKIPTSTPRGALRILVSDGETLDRMARTPVVKGRSLDLSSTIAVLNKEHANTRLYVSLLQANPEARVEDKVMPALPISVMNVFDGMRGTQGMVVVGESSVNEASARLDYVVSGSQVITVNVK